MKATFSRFTSGSIVVAMAASVLMLGACRVDVGYHRAGHGHDRGHDRGRGHRWSTDASAPPLYQAHILAADYELKLDSAKTVIAILNAPNQKQALRDAGVRVSDVKPLEKLALPSEDAIDRVALALGEEKLKVKQVMADFIDDMKAE